MPGVGTVGAPVPPGGEAPGAVTGAAADDGAGAEGKDAEADGDDEGAAGAAGIGLVAVLMASEVPAA